MRVLATVSLIVALAIGVSHASSRLSLSGLEQRAPVVTQFQGPRRPRIIAVLSDLLTHSPLAPCRTDAIPTAAAPARLRIGTWNIQAAQSARIDALAEELRAMEADIVGLQEVDVRTRRGGFIDGPHALAAALGFHYVFAASIEWDEGHYGLAVVSRWPLVQVQRHRLPYIAGTEPRIVLEATVCARGRPLRVFTHHADRRVASRAAGFVELKRILQPGIGKGILILGDLNEYPDAPGVRSLIDAGLVDLMAANAPSTVRTGRVDYLLADGPLARLASPARIWTTDKSDHHAVLADFGW